MAPCAPSVVAWKVDGNQRVCVKHDKRFALSEPCPDCVASITPALEAMNGAPDDARPEDYEDELRAYARGARAASVTLLNQGEPSIGAKWGDLYIKSMRLVDEMSQRRKQREHDLREMEHERDMSGRKGTR